MPLPEEFVPSPDDNTHAPEAGFFTWDMALDLVYADSALATLFGLDPDEAECGLPLSDYLDRVHPDDRVRLSKAIRDAIIARHPQQEMYRVRDAAGQYASVVAYGRCFSNREGTPVHYAGIVVPSTEADIAPSFD